LVRAAIRRWGVKWFRKKILGTYATRVEALAKEVSLHAWFDVKNHPLFFISGPPVFPLKGAGIHRPLEQKCLEQELAKKLLRVTRTNRPEVALVGDFIGDFRSRRTTLPFF
jgi:hypothetical protein